MSRKVNIVVLLALLLSASVLASVNFDQSHVEADQLEKEISDFHAELVADQIKSMKRLVDATAAPRENSFVCTGGQNPANLNFKQYLDAFAAGPCTPVIALAGISGTKLMVEIECETLKANHPDIFSACKWTKCSKGAFDIMNSVPKSEYRTWIPDAFAPMTVINPNENNKKCFAGLMSIVWERNSSGDLVQVPNKGATIKPMGLSKETRRSSRCGFDAICELVPLGSLAPKVYSVYTQLREKLEGRGYKIGLTLQAMPYDWRQAYYNNEIHREFKNIISDMASITGKKVSILAHSMGNINMMNVLKGLTPQERENWVQRYFALAPPFIGSPKTWSMLIGSAGGYDSGAVTMDFTTFSKTVVTYPSIFDLMPRNTWNIFKDADWLKSIQNRISLEQGLPPAHSLTPEQDIVSQIFSPPTDKCYSQVFAARGDDSCKTFMDDFSYFGSINGEKIYSDTIEQSLEKYSFNPFAAELFDQEDKRYDYDLVENPQVPTVIIYSALVNTSKEFHWDSDPTTITRSSNPNFVEPNSVVPNLGDNQVIITSTLAPGLKWASEFNSGVAGKFAEPVVFAELCSTKNPKSSIYQQNKSVIQNEYQSIPCSCNASDTEPCNHTGLVSEPNVVAYIADSLLDEQTASPVRKFDSWTEAQINSFVNDCDLLN
jgi:Lecithin:cholesterol acyltransferase